MKIFWLAVAGAAGVLARYGLSFVISSWFERRGEGMAAWVGGSAPLGILLINILGSFVLGFLATLAINDAISKDLRVILGTGFCGGFTTFSTFELDADDMLMRGAWSPAMFYVFGHVVLGFVAVVLGRLAALALRPVVAPT